jgi:hypothetical protein
MVKISAQNSVIYKRILLMNFGIAGFFSYFLWIGNPENPPFPP